MPTPELDETTAVYRFSSAKTVEMLRSKASRLATPELTAQIRTVTRSLALDGLGPTEDIQESMREGKLSHEVELAFTDSRSREIESILRYLITIPTR